MKKILGKKFFDRPTLEVAEDLLGKYLVRKTGGKETALMINEVEAYDGFQDRASHAYRGLTKRNQIMFGEAGRFYTYFTYGIHWMLNIVTHKKDYPAAVLIRGAGELNGPAKLTKYLKIDGKLNNKKAKKDSGLWIEDRGVKIKKSHIKRTPRIGIDSAGPIWSKKRWRFAVEEILIT